MCQYKTCYHDQTKGYVVQCAQCRKLQLGYGNIVINFHTNEFDSFRLLVQKLYDKHCNDENKHAKSILIPTPCDCVTLLLSSQDLAELHTMLEAADNELKAQSFMSMFNS